MSSVLTQFGLEDEVNESAEKEIDASKDDGTDSSGSVNEESADTEGKGDVAEGEGDSGYSTDDERTADFSEKKKSKIVKTIEQQLDEEKGFRTRLQRELKDAKEQINAFSELKTRFDELRGELNATKNKEEEPQITFEDNPIEFLRSQIEGIKESLGGLVQHTNNSQQISQQQQQINALVSKAHKSFASFGKENEDFLESQEFLKNVRLKQYETMGYSDTEAEQALNTEVLNLLNMSYKNDQNPAEVVYQIAKINGFKSKSGAKKIMEKVSKGSDKNKTMSDTGSGGTKEVNLMNLEDLAALNDTDFDKHWNSVIRRHRNAQN